MTPLILDLPAKLILWLAGTLEGLVKGTVQRFKLKEDPDELKEYTVTYLAKDGSKQVIKVWATYGFEATDEARAITGCKEVLLTWRPGMNDE